MLALTRNIGQEIVIGSGTRVRVLAISGSRVRLAIDATPDVRVLRQEVLELSLESNPQSERQDSDCAVALH